MSFPYQGIKEIFKRGKTSCIGELYNVIARASFCNTKILKKLHKKVAFIFKESYSTMLDLGLYTVHNEVMHNEELWF